jgi:hypothetical protein
VHAEEHEPDDRRGTVQPTGDLEGVSVEDPHGDSAPEQDHGRNDEQRREQAHRRLRRALRDIRAAACVVARETPPGAAQLQRDRRDQGETDEHVHRHEGVHAEQDGHDLDGDGSEQEQPHRRRQALVSGGINPTLAVRLQPPRSPFDGYFNSATMRAQ